MNLAELDTVLTRINIEVDRLHRLVDECSKRAVDTSAHDQTALCRLGMTDCIRTLNRLRNVRSWTDYLD